MNELVHDDAHELTVRSYELDSYAHVNNGAYIGWFENARECFLRRAGCDYAWFPDKLGLHIVVVNVNCDFKRAAKAGDQIVVRTRLAKIGKKSIAFRQTASSKLDGGVFARARTVMAFSDSNERSAECPDVFGARFTTSPDGDLWTASEGGERA